VLAVHERAVAVKNDQFQRLSHVSLLYSSHTLRYITAPWTAATMRTNSDVPDAAFDHGSGGFMGIALLTSRAESAATKAGPWGEPTDVAPRESLLA
jgi:hypothetical protein